MSVTLSEATLSFSLYLFTDVFRIIEFMKHDYVIIPLDIPSWRKRGK